MTKNPRIIIVGAGISGIAAARRLFENGYTKLTILEAENRIGGRIHSVKNSDNLIEIGAQWCHGEEDNVVYDLVKNMDVLGDSFNKYSNLKYYDSSGKTIDETLTDTLYSVFAQILQDEEALAKTDGSLGDYFMNRYNSEIKKLYEDDLDSVNTASKLSNWFHNFMLCYDGSQSWFDVGTSNALEYEECGGNLLLNWKNHGFSTILDVLMKKYPDGSEALPILETVHFGKEVRNISWNGDEVKVKCNDESLYVGDHVIFTSSLGVLKETHKEMFIPELPLYKQNAITGLGIGTVNKIFLRFPSKWWPDDCTGFSFVWNEEDRLRVANEFPYGPKENGKSWLEDIFGFYVIDSDPRTLMGWDVGSLVREVELLPDDIVLDGCKYILNKFLGSQYEIPAPVQMTRSKWYSNKHFRGSYSYRTVESDKSNVCAEDLARPLLSETGNLTLLFAGEATHPHFYSTAHGALETGFREADRIIDLYTRPEEKSCSVAIIGCGMAGLGAAHTFLEAGVKDILILEATDKPGGRINTLTLNDNIIELGAQWLHGTSNYLYKLAVENDLLLEETSEEGIGVYVRNDGFIFDEFVVKKIDFIIGKILEKCEKFVDSKTYPFSVGEFLEKEFNLYLNTCGENDEFKEMARQLYDWHYRFQVIDNSCCDLNEVSAKDWGKYSCLGNDGQKHMNIRDGYKSLVDILVKTIPKDTILLETPILRIDYNTNHKVHIKCRGGINVTASHVIVTPSVGVLKQNLIHFHPKLPERVLTTIKSLGFHGMGKVYLVFEKKWWTASGFQLIWNKQSLLSAERTWLRYITGFDTVVNQPNVLVGWIGGKGIGMMESLPEEILGMHCVELLRMFLKDSNIPLPSKVIRSTWTTCPWTRGAYSHTTPACDRANCGPATLSAPVEIDGVPRVLFAGEGAHTSHFSTTHGAFESGEAQAKFILKFFQRHKL